MRCKAGDLAVIVDCVPASNIGKIVRVISPAPPFRGDPVWYVECSGLVSTLGAGEANVGAGEANEVTDECLRPIRDQPGQDETLTWKERETA